MAIHKGPVQKFRGANINNALMDFEPKNPDAVPPPLPNSVPILVPMSTIHCEGCGAELQIPTNPHVYACPNAECRKMFWFPCEICSPENKAGCSQVKCAYDNGRYIEAVRITRGGTR